MFEKLTQLLKLSHIAVSTGSAPYRNFWLRIYDEFCRTVVVHQILAEHGARQCRRGLGCFNDRANLVVLQSLSWSSCRWPGCSLKSGDSGLVTTQQLTSHRHRMAHWTAIYIISDAASVRMVPPKLPELEPHFGWKFFVAKKLSLYCLLTRPMRSCCLALDRPPYERRGCNLLPCVHASLGRPCPAQTVPSVGPYGPAAPLRPRARARCVTSNRKSPGGFVERELQVGKFFNRALLSRRGHVSRCSRSRLIAESTLTSLSLVFALIMGRDPGNAHND